MSEVLWVSTYKEGNNKHAFDISNLRDILYFKLAVNHTHLRTGKQIKKEFSFASVAERDEYT